MEKMTTEQLLENAKMGMEDFSEDFTKSIISTMNCIA